MKPSRWKNWILLSTLLLLIYSQCKPDTHAADCQENTIEYFILSLKRSSTSWTLKKQFKNILMKSSFTSFCCTLFPQRHAWFSVDVTRLQAQWNWGNNTLHQDQRRVEQKQPVHQQPVWNAHLHSTVCCATHCRYANLTLWCKSHPLNPFPHPTVDKRKPKVTHFTAFYCTFYIFVCKNV